MIRYWMSGRTYPLRERKPCHCGCDTAGDPLLIGYLTQCNNQGVGFSIKFHDEATYQAVVTWLETTGKVEINPFCFCKECRDRSECKLGAQLCPCWMGEG